MLWWAYLRNTLKVVVREHGSYDRVREEMARKRLLTPGMLARMRAAGMELTDLPPGPLLGDGRRPELYTLADAADDGLPTAA